MRCWTGSYTHLIVADRMGRFPGADHDAYRAGVSGNAEEIPDIYMGIEYFTLDVYKRQRLRLLLSLSYFCY